MSVRRITPEVRTQLLAELDRWTRQEIASRGTFSLGGAARHLATVIPNGGESYNRDLVRELVNGLGDAVQLSWKLGFGREGLTPTPMSLATLLTIAETRFLKPDHQPRIGRPKAGERDRSVVNAGGLQKMRLGAAIAAEAVTGDKRALGDVGPEHFRWLSAEVNGGKPQWELAKRVAKHSDERARLRYIRKEGSDAGWTPAGNEEARNKHVGGISDLLNLAAEHGLLERGDQPVAQQHAPEWQPHLAELIGKVDASSVSPRSLKRGARVLALFATRRGWLDPASTDWAVVRNDIEAAAQKGELQCHGRNWARLAYNAMLHANGLTGAIWPLHNANPMTIVPRAAIEAGARKGDFAAWKTRDGQPLTQLVQGREALASWYEWVTCPTEQLEKRGLPPRKWPNPTAEQALLMAQGGLFELKCSSRFTVLNRVAYHAGVLVRHGANPATLQLEHLVDPATIEVHAAERGLAAGEPNLSLCRTATELAKIASPFLEARALQEQQQALGAGDSERASAAEARARRYHEWAAALIVRATRLVPARLVGSRDELKELSRKDIRRIWELWTQDGRSGWHKLILLRNHCITAAEHVAATEVRRLQRASFDFSGDSLPLSRQIDLIATEPAIRGALINSRSWALAVRDAAALTLLTRIPLRVSSFTNLTLDEWVSIPVQCSAPWACAIALDISREKMKGDRNFAPSLALMEDWHDAAKAERLREDLRPDLLHLYFMPGGAREALLTVDETVPELKLKAGDVVESPYVFPGSARVGSRTKKGRVERLLSGLKLHRDSWRVRLRALLKEHAKDLGLDFDRLDRIHGALSTHVIRLVFGSHHCDQRRWPDAIGDYWASLMLHHATVEFTRTRYSGVSERQVSVLSGVSQPGRSPATHSRTMAVRTTVSPVVVALRAKLERLVEEWSGGTISQAEFEGQCVLIEAQINRLDTRAAA
jgi:hypothetical protein